MVTARVMAASSPKFLPCACDSDAHMARHYNCSGFMHYEPQDIAKGERLAAEAGFPGFVLAYKTCWACPK